MAPIRRPTPIYMFNLYADMSQLTGEPGEGWIKMECDSKKAYGCGENIQEAVKGLALYVRLGEDPLVTSSLAIRMTDEALRRFDKELELGIRPPRPGFQPETTAWAHITTHAEGLTIMGLTFHRRYYRELGYILVYDHRRASLSVISPVDAPAVEMKPVPKRTCNGDYELLYMAFDENPLAPPNMDPTPFLCVFSQARAGANDDPAASPWEMRRKVRWSSVPESVVERFRTDLHFSFQGKAFWVDLSQGLEYCDLDLDDDTAAGDVPVVDFGYIELPSECVLDWEKALDIEQPMKVTRTMGCDSDSIWFVCIDESISDDCADNLVSMWTLNLLHGAEGKWKWKNQGEFSLRDLWRFDGFKEAGLPEALAGYPLLNAVDGVLYLVLTGKCLGPDEICWVDHVCGLDIRNKKLLWHGTVHNLHIYEPTAFPSCFFQMARAYHPAAGLPLLLLPGTGSKVALSSNSWVGARTPS